MFKSGLRNWLKGKIRKHFFFDRWSTHSYLVALQKSFTSTHKKRWFGILFYHFDKRKDLRKRVSLRELWQSTVEFVSLFCSPIRSSYSMRIRCVCVETFSIASNGMSTELTICECRCNATPLHAWFIKIYSIFIGVPQNLEYLVGWISFCCYWGRTVPRVNSTTIFSYRLLHK